MQKIIFTIAAILFFTYHSHAQCGKYLVRNSDPWGQTSDQSAMNAVFGTGNWTLATYSTGAASIFSASNCFVMMEGSEIGNPTALKNMLTANIALIESWVSNGGRLFINSAPNEGTSISCGFGGTVINYSSGPYCSNANAVNTSDPIFQGPSTPVVTTYTGGYFSHASVIGTGLTNLITGNTPAPAGTVILAYKKWGAGVVFFGTMTQPPFWSPQPQSFNLWNNIFNYVNVAPADVAISCSVSNTSLCASQPNAVQVNYTVTGNFSAGNSFTAQLSNAVGSFASPVNIGSVTSTASGIINATVPAGMAAGSGYRVRVVGSAPAVTGSINGTNITVNAAPVVSFAGLAANYCTSNSAVTLTGNPVGGVFTGAGITDNGNSTASFNPTSAGIGSYSIVYTYTNGSGCTNSASQNVNVVNQPTTTFITTAVTCNGNSNGTANITIINAGAGAPGTYSLDGGSAIAYGSNPFTITGLAPGNHTVVTSVTGMACSSVPTLLNIGEPALLTATYTKTNLSACSAVNDGSITVTPAGGSGNYSYGWTGTTGSGNPANTPFSAGNTASLTGLNYGFYNVTVTDLAGCGVVTINNIHVEFAYSVYITNSGSISSACGNTGSILLYGNAGLQPYTYSLNGTTYQAGNSFTGLAAGNYTAYVKDAAGCISTKPVTVSAAAPVVVSSYVNAASSCSNDGSVEIFRTGGISPYTYSRDGVNYQVGNTFSNLAAGPYTVYVKDSKGCIGSQAITISQGAALSVTASKTNTSGCVNDGSIQVNASGGVPPYTYSKDGGSAYQAGNAFSGLAAGNYAIKVKDSKGCTGSVNVTININSIGVTASVVNAGSCATSGGQIQLFRTGGTGPYTYSIDGNVYQLSPVFTNLPHGIYTGFVKDSRTCIAALSGIVVGPAGCPGTLVAATGTANSKINPKATAELKIQAYPNPSRTGFTLELQGYDVKEKVSITITDVLGRKVYQTSGTTAQRYRVGENLQPGIYLVQVSNGNEKKELRIVKE